MKTSARAIVVMALLTATAATSAVVAVAASDSGPAPLPPAPKVTGRGPAAPTFQPASETTYTAIAPCRIVDTRLTTAGRMTPNQTRGFLVGGTAGFPGQGGKSGGCGIPVGATSVAVTITAVFPEVAGYLRAWPTATPEPTATVLNYPGSGSTGTGATLAIDPASATALLVKNYAGRAYVVIDVNGFSQKPLAGFISPSGGTYAGSSRIVSSTRVTDPGFYEVTFDRDVRYCTTTASAYYYNYYASVDNYGAATGDIVRVRLFNAAGAAVNGYFSIAVTC